MKISYKHKLKVIYLIKIKFPHALNKHKWIHSQKHIFYSTLSKYFCSGARANILVAPTFYNYGIL